MPEKRKKSELTGGKTPCRRISSREKTIVLALTVPTARRGGEAPVRKSGTAPDTSTFFAWKFQIVSGFDDGKKKKENLRKSGVEGGEGGMIHSRLSFLRGGLPNDKRTAQPEKPERKVERGPRGRKNARRNGPSGRDIHPQRAVRAEGRDFPLRA